MVSKFKVKGLTFTLQSWTGVTMKNNCRAVQSMQRRSGNISPSILFMKII